MSATTATDLAIGNQLVHPDIFNWWQESYRWYIKPVYLALSWQQNSKTYKPILVTKPLATVL